MLNFLKNPIIMLKSWKMILIIFYLKPQTLIADNVNTAVDKLINSSIKAAAQPCNDFYSYACGNYNKQNFFRPSLKHKNLLDYANHQYNTAIIDVLEKYEELEHIVGENCYDIAHKIINYFASCRKVVNTRNLTRYLDEMKPGPDLNWPILENESGQVDKWPHGKNFDVFYLLGKLRSVGIENVMLRAFDGVVLPFEAANQSTLPNTTILLKILTSIGVTNSTKVLEDVLETDKILLDILRATSKQILLHLRTSFGDLIKRFPNLNFESYFMDYIGTQLPVNTPFSIRNPSFFQELNDKMWLLLDKSKLCTYLMMRYLVYFDTTNEYNDMFCVKELREMFNLALNSLYYDYNRYHQEKRVRPDVTTIFETVIDMLGNHLQSHDLGLTIYQIEFLRKRLSSIRLNVGNLPVNITCEKLEELYSEVPPLDEKNYYKNHLLKNRFVGHESLKADSAAILDSNKLANPPAVIYKRREQLIALNYAYLIPPVYDYHYNNLGKYSILGLILAQKLVEHCDFVHLNDERLSNISKPLESALECLKVDRNIYKIPERRVEDNVASEVIRKIVTLKFFNLQPIKAVPAWKKHFFLNLAQHYCSSINMADAYNDAESDRLNRIVMNIEGFSQAYNCSLGSKMNSTEKCQI